MGNPKSGAEYSLGAIQSSAGSINRVFLNLSQEQRELFLINFMNRFTLSQVQERPVVIYCNGTTYCPSQQQLRALIAICGSDIYSNCICQTIPKFYILPC